MPTKANREIKIALVYFHAGGGHRAAALALQAELVRQHPEWTVSLVDLFQVLDPKQQFRRLTGFAPEAYYNKRLATGFTLGLSSELKLLQAIIRMSHPYLVARLSDFWREFQATMVVSLVPNFNRAISDSLTGLGTSTAFVTVMTDLTDHPPHFWFEPGHTKHLICRTDHAASGAIARGADAQNVYRTSGMIISSRFYEPFTEDRHEARRSMGLSPDDTVGLVMFGGHGSNVMKRIATALPDKPLILICGKNEALRRSLLSLPTKAARHVVGFTDNVARWMRLADYFIGKPGPGAVSEALHCGLPVIVTRNAWTMPQERWNTEWIREQEIGYVLPSFRKIHSAVQMLTAEIERLRRNVERVQNHALFEVPCILEQILQGERGSIRPTGESLICAETATKSNHVDHVSSLT